MRAKQLGRARSWTLAVLCVVACGEVQEDGDLGVIDGIATSAAGIRSFLRDKAYGDWRAEPAIHASTGPHGRVRVYFNDVLATSLESDATTFPLGAASVKELYDDTTLSGYAFMLKVQESGAPEAWLWWEGFAPEFEAQVYGRGIGGCDGCHGQGRDKVVSRLPE